MLRNSLIFTVLLTSWSAFGAAKFGPSGSGGGDSCENRFQQVALVTLSWVDQGGGKAFAKELAAIGLTPDIYKERMTAKLQNFQVRCVSKGDPGYPVLVHGKPKECRSFVDKKHVNQVICDRKKFYSDRAQPDNDPGQYPMTHHEFATLSKIEKPDDDVSHYTFSNRLTESLERQTVYRLAINTGTFTDDSIHARYPWNCHHLAEDGTVESDVPAMMIFKKAEAADFDFLKLDLIIDPAPLTKFVSYVEKQEAPQETIEDYRIASDGRALVGFNFQSGSFRVVRFNEKGGLSIYRVPMYYDTDPLLKISASEQIQVPSEYQIGLSPLSFYPKYEQTLKAVTYLLSTDYSKTDFIQKLDGKLEVECSNDF